MKKAVYNSLAVLAAAITIVLAFYNEKLQFTSQGWSFWVVILIIAISGMFLLVHEWWLYFSTRPQAYVPKSAEINDYMRKWLRSGGRSLILSRDLTWVSEREAEILKEKASKNELELLVADATELVTELEKLGAKIHIYGKLKFNPTSRFTIIDYGSKGQRIAIGGVNKKSKHVITEHADNDDHVFNLAIDLKTAIIHGCSDG